MYLSTLQISNYKGIKTLEIRFKDGINVLIGENAAGKTAVVGAIRALYNLGMPGKLRDLWIDIEDFHITSPGLPPSSPIKFVYEFSDLTTEQTGALCAYIVPISATDAIARFTLEYYLVNGRVIKKYFSGANPHQTPEGGTFEIFQHYYLEPLRDCERDMHGVRKNILGDLVGRFVSRGGTENNFTNIVQNANVEILAQPEVVDAKRNINDNLTKLFPTNNPSEIGIRFQKPEINAVLNSLKPFLPSVSGGTEGLSLRQNSLGYNNIIYISTILGDIAERAADETVNHFGFLIEEPEAHLHPQLQVALYNFLRSSLSANSQLFITSHSPTLTSKVPLDELIVLRDRAYCIANLFEDREKQGLKHGGIALKADDYKELRTKLERYIDVTRSQLFFARGLLLVEGISEELLVPSLAKECGINLDDLRIEVVSVRGTSFYPFVHLLSSNLPNKRIPVPMAVLTDGDRFTGSNDSKYGFSKLIADPIILDELVENIYKDEVCSRVGNLESIASENPAILIRHCAKTFELSLVGADLPKCREDLGKTPITSYLAEKYSNRFKDVIAFANSLPKGTLSREDKRKLAVLIWKMLPSKAEFAQELAIYCEAKSLKLKVPIYIQEGLKHLAQSLAQ